MGILSSLQSDPKGTLIMLCYLIPAILISLTLHELAHGYVAYRCGDPTAKMLGRLTFNPIKHLDPIGTVFMLLFGFGWAKPVPVNSRNFKHFRRDDLLVSVAGVVMNFCLFIVAMLLITLVNELIWNPELWTLNQLDAGQYPLLTRRDFLSFDGYNFYSVFSGENVLFTSIASETSGYVMSADAYAHFLQTPWLLYVQRFLMLFARINLGLCIFNLIPIPPLDGYHVVNDIFLQGKLHIPAQVMQGIMVALLIFMWMTDYISIFLTKAVSFVQGGVLSAILAIFGLG